MAESLKSLIQASKGKLSEVGKSPASQQFEVEKEEESIKKAAQRAGKTPEEIKDEAKKAGVNVISWIKDKYPVPAGPKKPAERKSSADIVSSPVNRIETPEEKEARIEGLKEDVKAKKYTPATPETIVDKVLTSIEDKPGSSIAAFDMKSGKRDRSKEAVAKAQRLKKAEKKLEEGTVSVDPSKAGIIMKTHEGGKELPLDQQFRDSAGKILPLTDPRVQSLTKKLGIETGVKSTPVPEVAPATAAAETPAPTPAAAPKATPAAAPAAKTEEKKAAAAPLTKEVPGETVKEKVKKGTQSQARKSITPAKQFAIITAENPRFAASEGGNEALKKDLEAKGYKVETIQGKYGALEQPFLVESPKPEDIKALGKKYGQESVILADKNSYKMEYTSGPKEGQYHSADKLNVFSTPPDDYYSTVVRDGKPIHFNIDFNMDKLEGQPVTAATGKSVAQIVKKPATGKAGSMAEEAADVTKITKPAEPPSALKTLQEGFKAQSTQQQLLSDTATVLKQAGASDATVGDEAAALLKKAQKAATTSGEPVEGTLKRALTSGLEAAKENPKTALFALAAGAIVAAATAGRDGGKAPPSPPSPPGPGPAPGPAPGPGPSPNTRKKGEDTIRTGGDTLTEFEKYKKSISLTDSEEQKFAGIEDRLQKSLDSAREAYSEGMRSTELFKALEKIAEGLVLYGAGLYGTKTGVDAVSGLKFSPIDWSTRTDRLTKELDIAEKSYSKGMETVKEEKRGIERLRKEAMDFEEARKERALRASEKQAAAETVATEKTARAKKDVLEGKIKDLDRTINDIEKARTATPKSKDAMQRQYSALATTLNIPESEYMTGMFGGFSEDAADKAFLKKQQELIAQRAELEKQLRGETAPAQPSKLTPEKEARRQELQRKAGEK